MEKINTIKVLIEQAEIEANCFHKKNNIRAGTRYRGLLKKIKVFAQEIRMETLEKKKLIIATRQKRKK